MSGERNEPISRSKVSKSLPQLEEVKIQQIKDSCRREDLKSLQSLAASEDGFVNDETRRVAWPLLLGCSSEQGLDLPLWESLPPHHDENQVQLDVDRSFVYYPQGETEKQIDFRRGELRDIITQTLRRHPVLNYFQGYHDIVQVLLLVLGRESAMIAMPRLSLLRIRDFMLPTMTASVSHLSLLPPILKRADPKLEAHLSLTRPFYALPATLTLYAHDIQEYGDVSRLFDFLLSWPASIPVYLFATIIIARRDELLEIESEEPDMLHATLSKLPKPLNLDTLIADTVTLFQANPPRTLSGGVWRKVSSYSVLKTAQDLSSLRKQSLAEGEQLLEKHSSQQRRMQQINNAGALLWRIRRPTGAVALAVFVGALSWWIRRDNFGNVLSLGLQQLQDRLRTFR